MKRLCVFYVRASQWLGKPVEWIVCKECQAKLRKGQELHTNMFSWQKWAKDQLKEKR